MRLPLPFTITIHGIAYDRGSSSRGVFSNELRKHLEQTITRDLQPDIEVDTDIVVHEYLYRKDWKEDDDSEQD